VSALVPNLGELSAALPEDSVGAQVVAAFNVDDLSTAKLALRALMTGWEQTYSGLAPAARPATLPGAE